MIRTVIHFTDSNTFGGTEQVLLQILEGLDRQCWRPVLFFHSMPELAPLLKKAQHLGVKLRTVPRIQTIQDIGRLPGFIRALRAERPSIFHAHLSWPLACKYGLVASVLTRVPAVVATAHLYFDLRHRRLLHAQPRLIAACVDRYLAVSRAVADQLIGDFGIPASKVQIVQNGVSIARFSRPANAALRAEFVLGTSPVVLMVGRLEKQKGQRYLIEAATQIQEARFIFVGEGPDRAALEAQAQALGVGERVAFLGHREDIPDLLACCDLFVLPSLYEGLPLAILEAMAAGKPVIASDIRGNDEVVINGETGLLVPDADSTALAGAIRAVLSDHAFAQRLAEAGRARVCHEFAEDNMVSNVAQVYDDTLNVLAATGSSQKLM